MWFRPGMAIPMDSDLKAVFGRYMHIFLFGGTTEGRKIVSEIAGNNEERNIAGMYDFLETDVYVATDYGAGMLPQEKHVHVHVGRLDAEEMFGLFRDAVLREEDEGSDASQVLVIDATHPYATVVTENIVEACKKADVNCFRVYRPKGRLSGREMPERGSSDFLYFDTVKEAAEWLKTVYEERIPADSFETFNAARLPGLKSEGGNEDIGIRNRYGNKKNILITTGSKELQEYTVIPGFSDYCYVRALPTPEVLEKCMNLGFRRDKLILMQGPFKEDMNLAQMRYADAGFLVTKDSGEIGGFPEKCDAAIELGVKVLVIGRPKEVSVPNEDRYQVITLREVLGVISLL